MKLSKRLFIGLLLMLAALPATPHGVHAQEAPTEGELEGAAVTVIHQDITHDTTWTKAGSPYAVTDLLTVRAGARLTIEPGVQVVFGDPAQPQALVTMIVNGALDARGTAAEPIVFTALVKQPGKWGGIDAGNTEEQPAQVVFDHVVVEYGDLPNLWGGGNLVLSDAVADINHSTFRLGGSNGLAADEGTTLTLRNSSFTDNTLDAVWYETALAKDPTLSNLTASGNGGFNAVVYRSVTVTQQHRLEKMGLPYILGGGLNVDAGGKLTVDPGVEMRMDTGFFVDGALEAVGTAAEPILITGIKQEPGGWWGLSVTGDTAPASALLDHVTLEYGGGSSDSESRATLVVASADVTVTNSILRSGKNHGILDNGGAPDEEFAVSISDTAITGHGKDAVVCTDESCRMTLNNLQVSGNGVDGIVYRTAVLDNVTWRNLGLPYIVEGPGGVMSGATLTIEPGVEVRMAQGADFAVTGFLSAVGTADQPIRFTGAQQQPGWWQSITVRNKGSIQLAFCDIGYGGNWGAGFDLGMVLAENDSLQMTNCRIHDSSSAGIDAGSHAQIVVHNNRIENNAVGLRAASLSAPLDVRNNWWGHASGPQHPNNPNGQGQQIIGDNILFDPWLTSPDSGGGEQGIVVELNGPGLYAPGDTIVYGIYYKNATTQPINDAVLRFGMPANATLLENSAGGLFHTLRNHVFWKLGNLPAGGQGLAYVKVQYDWGLPDGISTATAAQLSGSDLPNPLFNVSDYLTYIPRTIQSVTDLSAGQVDALRASSPELETLYQQALADGFKFGTAEQHVYSTGEQENEIRLLRFTPQFSLLSLWLANGNAVGTLVDGSSYTVIRDGKAVRYDLQTNAWSPTTLGMLQTAAAHEGMTWSECVTNCIEDKLPGYILKKKIKELSTLSKISACVKSVQGDESAYLGCAKWIGKKIPFIGEGIDLGQCNGECQLCEESGGSCSNPNCHCCTEDKYRCDAGDWLYGTFGIDVIKMKKCSLDEGDDFGTYLAEVVTQTCALCEKCMYGGADGAPVCVAKISSFGTINTLATVVQLAAQQGAQDKLEIAASGDGECDKCSVAKDPNEMIGPSGDLLPGELVTYQIAYENVGAGTAFGVFVMNKLPPDVFDLATLQIDNGGTYSGGSGSITWDVGDLAPAGQPGAKGVVSYSVRLRSDLPSGTIIANGAVVHFPSVPEETPTNRVINLVKPLVAEPQELQTEVGAPLAITLTGRDAAGAALTYTVVDGPSFGTLSGSAPNLQYTPDSGAGALERIRFTVSNGTATSTPADVSIRVLPSAADVTGPSVQWTAPENGSQVLLAALLVGTDSTGSYYYPAIQAQFSEAVDPATVNGQTVIVTDAAGRQMDAAVRYDSAVDQVQVLLREEPQVGQSYAVTVTPGVKDLRGNALPAAYSWSFTITGVRQPADQPKVFLPVVAR